jgi:Tat protein translocase TatB subunit
MDILGIGFAEIVFILIIAMMVFGPRRLPEIAAKAGKTVRDLRNMSNGLLAEWQREITVAARLEELEKAKQDFNQMKEEFTGVKQEITDAKTSVTDMAKTISPPDVAELEAVAMGKPKDGKDGEAPREADSAQSEADAKQSQISETPQSGSASSNDNDIAPVVETTDIEAKQTPPAVETPAKQQNGTTTPSPKETPPVSSSEPEKLVND